MPTEVIIVKAVQTCRGCPSQWDAWDLDGHYWYLRYRHNRISAERQPGPYSDEHWVMKTPEIVAYVDDPDISSGVIDLKTFCQITGLNIHPNAEII